MDSKTIIANVYAFALSNSEKNDIHGFSHVERVLKLSSEIGTELNANLSVIKIATLLHDVGRFLKKDDKIKNHAELSAVIAEDFINKNDFNIPIGDVENILHCIRAHSFSNDLEPKTLEAKILSDADKLDAIGAVGLYRTIGFTVLRDNPSMEHFQVRFFQLEIKLI